MKQNAKWTKTLMATAFGVGMGVAMSSSVIAAGNSTVEERIEQVKERTAGATETGEDRAAREDIQEAAQVLQQMQSDKDLQQALSEAKGVFIVPDYATASLIIGGSGGEGVLLSRADGQWGQPIMYDVGSISAGLQAGVAAGSIAMILMSDDSLAAFENENNFSLNAEAGLSIINWSARTQASLGKGGDVIVWTDTEGLFGEVSVGVTDINYDEEENREFYGQNVKPQAIMNGEVQAPSGNIFGRTAQR